MFCCMAGCPAVYPWRQLSGKWQVGQFTQFLVSAGSPGRDRRLRYCTDTPPMPCGRMPGGIAHGGNSAKLRQGRCATGGVLVAAGSLVLAPARWGGLAMRTFHFCCAQSPPPPRSPKSANHLVKPADLGKSRPCALRFSSYIN